MLDGVNNSVVQVDSVQDDEDVGSATNYYGNGFKTVKTVYKTAKGAVADYDATKARCWVIENPNKKHYCTGGNVGYKLSEWEWECDCEPDCDCSWPVSEMCTTDLRSVSKDMPPLLAKPGSLVWNRAPFARHNVSASRFRTSEQS